MYFSVKWNPVLDFIHKLYNFIFLQVDFEEFKECFVAILSQDIPADDAFKANGSEDAAGSL